MTWDRRALIPQAVCQALRRPLPAHGPGARAQAEDRINTDWAGRRP